MIPGKSNLLLFSLLTFQSQLVICESEDSCDENNDNVDGSKCGQQQNTHIGGGPKVRDH